MWNLLHNGMAMTGFLEHSGTRTQEAVINNAVSAVDLSVALPNETAFIPDTDPLQIMSRWAPGRWMYRGLGE